MLWIPLLNTKTYTNEHWVTDPKTGKEVMRNEFYIHAGTRSDGCLTFKSTGKNGLLEHEGVAKIRELLSKTKRLTAPTPTIKFGPSGPMVYKQTFPGILVVK